MVPSNRSKDFPTCFPSVSGKPITACQCRILSRSPSDVGPRMHSDVAAPSPIVVDSQSNVPPIRTMLSTRSVLILSHFIVPGLVSIDGVSKIPLAWRLPGRMLIETVSTGCSSCTSSDMPTTHSAICCPNPSGSCLQSSKGYSEASCSLIPLNRSLVDSATCFFCEPPHRMLSNFPPYVLGSVFLGR